jgi:hypothetical protein
MAPLDRRRLRSGHPPQAVPMIQRPAIVEGDDWQSETPPESQMPRRGRQDVDPIFGYVMAMALSVGLTPVPDNTRYVVLWAVLALMGGTAFTLGSGIRFKVTDPGDLVWGLGLGVITGGGLMLVGWDTLAVTAERLFAMGQEGSALLNTWIFQATAFVMPLSETLFFRGAMQRVHGIPTVALLASAWSMLMFFPNLGLSEAPVVGIVIGTALVVLNFLYSYVNYRHGLAASYVCQVVAGTLLLLVPLLLAG